MSTTTGNVIDPNLYKLLSDSYYTAGGYLDGSYVIQAPAENDEKYVYRKAMAVYQNYYRQIVDANIVPLGSGIVRTFENSVAQSMFENADGNGTTYAEILKAGRLEAENLGCVVYFWDSAKEQPDNLKDAKDNWTLPKLRKVTPKQMTELALYAENEIRYMSYQSGVTSDNTPIYTVYVKDKAGHGNTGYFYESTSGAIDESYGKMNGTSTPARHEPIISTTGTYADPRELPPSKYIGCAQASLEMFNSESKISYQKAMTTFNIMLMPDTTLEPKDIKLNEQSMLVYNTKVTDGQAPSYLAPENTMEQIRQQTTATKDAMYESNNLNVLGTSADASGASRAYSDIIRIENLKQNSKTFVDLENQLLTEFSKIAGIEGAEFSVSYPTEFATLLLGDKIANAQGMIDLGVDADNKKLVIMDALKAYFPDATQEELEDMRLNEEKNPLYDEDFIDPANVIDIQKDVTE